MDTLFIIGLAVWLIGAGVAKMGRITNAGEIGGLAQIIGGVLVLVSALV